MKLPFFLLFLSAAAFGAPAERLSNFDLTDQHLNLRSYRFPKARVTVMTIADHKGSDQLAPWIQQLHDRYHKKIDIDGVADVSNVPKPLQGVLRATFRNQLAYSVMLDWNGTVVRQFAYRRGVANIYVIDRRGQIVNQTTGPVSAGALLLLARAIDNAISDS
jgi:hypothetical protein